jgi:hypothetical protein
MQAIQIEKQLGMGMTKVIDGHIMDSTVIATILWGALQLYQHGTSLKDVCTLYDEYIEEGGNIDNITDIIMELFTQIGIGGSSERKNKKGQKENDLIE